MRIRCPHCQNAVNVVEDWSTNDVECKNCGSVFTLVDDDATQPHIREGKMIAHFQLLDILGRGSFGTVWKARDTRLDRLVAVKLPRKEDLGKEDLQSFIREARAAGQLSHPNIVPVYEVGKFERRIYIVAEYIDGVTLKAWANQQPLPPRESAEICLKLASALEHAHERGVIHRDLKPGNILFDRNNEPHVTDFGLARRENGELTVTVDGAVLGTLFYMSPEQAEGNSHLADRRSDVYSLGVVLFELLTGSVPFRGEKQMVVFQIKTEDPPLPRKLNAKIPIDLETICLQCLKKRPEHRYQSCKELADELMRFLAGRPIMARPTSNFERLLRWAKREPAKAGFVAAVGLFVFSLALGGPLVAWQQYQLAKQQTELAKEQKNRQQEKQKADQDRIEMQVELLATVGHDAAEAIVNSLRPEEKMLIPVLERKLADSSQIRAKISAAAALVQLGHASKTTRQILIDSIANAESSDGRVIINALMSDPDRQSVLADINTRVTAARSNPGMNMNRMIATQLHLGDTSGVSDILRIANGSSAAQTHFVHSFKDWIGRMSGLADALESLSDPTTKSALCLALGDVDPDYLDAREVTIVLRHVSKWYVEAVDAQTHSASKWLLKRWNKPLPEIDQAAGPDVHHDWYCSTTGLTMLRVASGNVELGAGTRNSEFPIKVHKVTVEKEFWMSDTEITVRLFNEFLSDSEHAKDAKATKPRSDRNVNPYDDCPVILVTLEDAMQFCNWLSRKEGLELCYEKMDEMLDPSSTPGFTDLPKIHRWRLIPNANGYCIPTFAEWEIAIRAGTSSQFFFGDAAMIKYLSNYARHSENSWIEGRRQTDRCGAAMPNGFGFFDMVGNVQEMCWDIPQQIVDEPLPEFIRASRGGAFDMGADQCFSGTYLSFVMSVPMKNLGFRVVNHVVRTADQN